MAYLNPTERTEIWDYLIDMFSRKYFLSGVLNHTRYFAPISLSYSESFATVITSKLITHFDLSTFWTNYQYGCGHTSWFHTAILNATAAAQMLVLLHNRSEPNFASWAGGSNTMESRMTPLPMQVALPSSHDAMRSSCTFSNGCPSMWMVSAPGATVSAKSRSEHAGNSGT